MHQNAIDPWFLDRARRSRDGRLNAYETLDARRTALVVVDMQNYFVEEGMPSCAPMAREIVPNINRLAEATRSAGATSSAARESCFKDRDGTVMGGTPSEGMSSMRAARTVCLTSF